MESLCLRCVCSCVLWVVVLYQGCFKRVECLMCRRLEQQLCYGQSNRAVLGYHHHRGSNQDKSKCGLALQHCKQLWVLEQRQPVCR